MVTVRLETREQQTVMEDAETQKQEMMEGAREVVLPPSESNVEDDQFLLLDRTFELWLKTAAEEAERKWSLSLWDQQEVIAQQSERNAEDDWLLLLEVVPRGTSYTPPGSSTSLLHWALSPAYIPYVLCL